MASIIWRISSCCLVPNCLGYDSAQGSVFAASTATVICPIPAPDTLAFSSLQLLVAVDGQCGTDVPALQRAIGFDPNRELGPGARVPLATI